MRLRQYLTSMHPSLEEIIEQTQYSLLLAMHRLMNYINIEIFQSNFPNMHWGITSQRYPTF